MSSRFSAFLEDVLGKSARAVSQSASREEADRGGGIVSESPDYYMYSCLLTYSWAGAGDQGDEGEVSDIEVADDKMDSGSRALPVQSHAPASTTPQSGTGSQSMRKHLKSVKGAQCDGHDATSVTEVRTPEVNVPSASKKMRVGSTGQQRRSAQAAKRK
eukprot:2244847-Pleurochrysis_carterae.AAC.2